MGNAANFVSRFRGIEAPVEVHHPACSNANPNHNKLTITLILTLLLTLTNPNTNHCYNAFPMAPSKLQFNRGRFYINSIAYG